MEKSPFYRDMWVEVNLDAIYDNLTRIKSIIPKNVEIFAVVKANAYGHGSVQVANTALAAGAARLAVAFLDEALVLRRAGISYNVTYRAKTEEWIAILPVGYADGWLRRLQGFKVLVNDIRVPIAGRVTMDMMMIHVPYEVPLGTKVTLIGRQSDQYISANEVAEYSETINYEIIATISFRVSRVYVKNGKVVEVVNYLNDI